MYIAAVSATAAEPAAITGPAKMSTERKDNQPRERSQKDPQDNASSCLRLFQNMRRKPSQQSQQPLEQHSHHRNISKISMSGRKGVTRAM